MSLPDYPHKFRGPIEGYVVNQLAANYWKVEAEFSRLDVLQEAFLVFDRVARKYPAVEDRHLMALFKTAWYRRFIDMARECSAARGVVHLDAGERTEEMGDPDNAGYLRTLIRQMPGELATVVNLFLNGPAELLDTAREQWAASKSPRAAANAQVCTWLGLRQGATPIDDVEDYFTN